MVNIEWWIFDWKHFVLVRNVENCTADAKNKINFGIQVFWKTLQEVKTCLNESFVSEVLASQVRIPRYRQVSWGEPDKIQWNLSVRIASAYVPSEWTPGTKIGHDHLRHFQLLHNIWYYIKKFVDHFVFMFCLHSTGAWEIKLDSPNSTVNQFYRNQVPKLNGKLSKVFSWNPPN